jgi:hypothetical protein
MAHRALRGRRRTVTRDGHDDVGWAGWLYADLILGLFAVALGAITIPLVVMAGADDEEVPEASDSSEGVFVQNCVQAIDRNHVELVLRRDLRGAELAAAAESQISDAVREREELSSDVTFPFAIIFGRPDATNTSSRAAQGVARARDMRDVLLPALSDRLANVVERTYFEGGDASVVRVELFPLVDVCG